MAQDVSKCSLDCDKSDCGYKNSQGLEMNFKYYCIDGDKYFLEYDKNQGFRDTVKVEEVKEIPS